MMRRCAFLLAMALGVFVTACGARDSENTEALHFLVAASMTDAAHELADGYADATNAEVKVIPGPSNSLATQILAGAPADVYLSANRLWADAVADAGMAARRVDLLGNELVLVVPNSNPAKVSGPEDLTPERIERLALAGEEVPAGKYAEQALDALGLYAPLLAEKRIARGNDVRITLSYVERGEADAGIVYATDARISEWVRVVHRFDPGAFEAIVYPAVLVNERPEAVAFFDYLRSAEARAVFERYGFTVLDGASE